MSRSGDVTPSALGWDEHGLDGEVPAADSRDRDGGEADQGPLHPGLRVGEYIVDSLLDRGGMGWVYAGTHPVIGKRVAIKVLRSALAADPSALRRFVDEAKSVNLIGHPNIIDIFAFGSLDDGSPYCVMDLHPGQSLRNWLVGRVPVPYSDVLPIVEQVLDALEAAHWAGIVHRDLKPGNIFLVDRGEGSPHVKLLDFGVAKLGAGAGSTETGTGVPIGTPAYMAPEQSLGRQVDARADLYALGVILYEMLAGVPPFSGDSHVEVLFAQVHYPPLPLAARVELPPALDTLVLWCLQKSPAARPADVATLRMPLVTALRDAVASGRGAPHPHSASAQDRIARTLTSTPSAAASELRSTLLETHAAALGFAPPRRPRVGRWTLGTLGAGLAAVLAATIFWSDIRGDGPKFSTRGALPTAVVKPAGLTRDVVVSARRSHDLTRREVIEAVVRALIPPPVAKVRVLSEPSGAEVTWDGRALGRTPLDLDLPVTERPIALELAHADHERLVHRCVIRRDTEVHVTLSPFAAPRRPVRPATLEGFKLVQ